MNDGGTRLLEALGIRIDLRSVPAELVGVRLLLPSALCLLVRLKPRLFGFSRLHVGFLAVLASLDPVLLDLLRAAS